MAWARRLRIDSPSSEAAREPARLVDFREELGAKLDLLDQEQRHAYRCAHRGLGRS
jgi:hypothetical protein